jgi:hypothetical protein
LQEKRKERRKCAERLAEIAETRRSAEIDARRRPGAGRQERQRELRKPPTGHLPPQPTCGTPGVQQDLSMAERQVGQEMPAVADLRQKILANR